MKPKFEMLRRLGLGIGLAFGVLRCASGQNSGTHVEIDVGGTASTGNPNYNTFLHFEQADGVPGTSSNLGLVSVNYFNTASYDNTMIGIDNVPEGTHAIAQVDARAHAQTGLIGVSLGGLVSAANDTTFRVAGYFGQGDVSSTHCEAEWNDYIIAKAPGKPDGSLIIAHSYLKLSGTPDPLAFSSDAFPDAHVSSAQFDLTLTGHGGELGGNGGNGGLPTPPVGGVYFGAWKGSSSGVGDVDMPPPTSIPITLFLEVGKFYQIGYALDITGEATANSNQDFENTIAGSVNSIFDIDFSHTLAWGGITSVTDATTGQPIDGWTITSQSGFDYSKPAPEPSSIALAALGASILLACRRRR